MMAKDYGFFRLLARCREAPEKRSRLRLHPDMKAGVLDLVERIRVARDEGYSAGRDSALSAVAETQARLIAAYPPPGGTDEEVAAWLRERGWVVEPTPAREALLAKEAADARAALKQQRKAP